MKNADIAFYRAKEQGRNQFQFYSAEMDGVSLKSFTIQSDLSQALGRWDYPDSEWFECPR